VGPRDLLTDHERTLLFEIPADDHNSFAIIRSAAPTRSLFSPSAAIGTSWVSHCSSGCFVIQASDGGRERRSPKR
jgi:hypothetical protein